MTDPEEPKVYDFASARATREAVKGYLEMQTGMKAINEIFQEFSEILVQNGVHNACLSIWVEGKRYRVSIQED